MLKLGVIGVGGMGGWHVQMLQGNPRIKVVAVCDIDPPKLDVHRANGIECFEDSAELIRSGKVDAVLIATPHYFHTTIGIDALDNGLHVLVEKPISVHKKDCERLIAAAKRHPKQIFAAMFNMRTEPSCQKIRQLIQSGELGEFRRVNWIITDWFRTQSYYDSGGWRATWKGEGGGVLLNQCPHNLDMLQWLCGMPSRVRATCNLGRYHNIEVEDDVTAYLEYPNGATGVFITSTGEAPGSNRLEIVGDRGKLVLEGGKLTFVRNEIPASEFCANSSERFARPPVWVADIPIHGKATQHQGIHANFVAAIEDGVPLIAPAEEGINSVELCNAMLYSSFTGKTVDLPLNGDDYEAKLMEMIANSRFEKKTKDMAMADLDSSFK